MSLEVNARENLLVAAQSVREGRLRWPHDEMCLARWDGFREAASIALEMDPADLDALLDGGR